MTEALAVAAPAVTSDELALITRTVAKDATKDELKLYLYDCARQGVHPLDKLIHFTKRSGKYTPITSIDFMRIRAADTGEYAGSDDATFEMLPVAEKGSPFALVSATVKVWRLVQGQRCAFTATARWSEYKPEQNDFMWRKMPHTMLAKCAEALALRKGFPRQLAGLYAKEEMDQAGPVGQSYTIEAPAIASSPNGKTPDFGSGDAGSIPADAVIEGPDAGVDLPSGVVRIVQVEKRDTKNVNVKKFLIVLSDGREITTIKDQLGALCEQFAQDATPIRVETKDTKWGTDLIGVFKYEPDAVIDAEIAKKDEMALAASEVV